MFLHSTHSSCTECFEKTDKQMDGCVDKQRDWPLLSLLFQAIPFAGAAAACDQREIFFLGSRGERFSASYHSACDIRLRGPPAKHPPETSPASALTRREIIGLPGYCKREVAHFRAFPFLSVSSNHFPHQKVVIMRSHFGYDVKSKCVHDSDGAEEIG